MWLLGYLFKVMGTSIEFVGYVQNLEAGHNRKVQNWGEVLICGPNQSIPELKKSREFSSQELGTLLGGPGL